MKLATRSHLFLVAVAVAATPVFGAAYDVAQDFSPSVNANGAWSYGWSASLGSNFNLDPGATSVNGIDFWYAGNLEPFIAHNGSSSFQTYGTGQYIPGTLALHPGPSGENAVIRWTAPSGGSYSVSAIYTGLDPYSTTTDVNMLRNGISVFGANLTGYLATQSYSGTLSMNAGDTLDFSVGYGSNGNYFNDTTGLSASISAVPDSGSSFSLIALGLASLVGISRTSGCGRSRGEDWPGNIVRRVAFGGLVPVGASSRKIGRR